MFDRNLRIPFDAILKNDNECNTSNLQYVNNERGLIEERANNKRRDENGCSI